MDLTRRLDCEVYARRGDGKAFVVAASEVEKTPGGAGDFLKKPEMGVKLQNTVAIYARFQNRVLRWIVG